jgi:hypothetical protein
MSRKAAWARFGANLQAAADAVAARTPYKGGRTWHGVYWPTWWGSSDEFAAEVRAHFPELSVDERSVVPLDGRENWGPGDETPPPPGEPCPKCEGRIGPGSDLYCPKCHASGHEDRLAGQRKLAGKPPEDLDAWALPLGRNQDTPGVEPATAPPATPQKDVERRLTRRERRAARFGRSGRGPKPAPRE